MTTTKYWILNSFWMYVDKNDVRDLKGNKYYNLKQTRKVLSLVKKGDTVLDIGAHIGYFTLSMTINAKVKTVYAFEPDQYNFQILSKNIAVSKIKNVKAYNAAVVDPQSTNTKNNTINLYTCESNSGMNRIYPSKWCSTTNIQKVKTVGIDDLILDKEPKIDFIKMDIEGSEYGALKGMARLLARDRPTMMMEFHPPSMEEYGSNPKQVYKFLRKYYDSITLLSYKRERKDIENITYEELEEITRINPAMDILCT